MTYNIQLLTDPDHLNEAAKLWALRDRIMRTPRPKNEVAEDTLNGHVFGHFSPDGKLNATIRVVPMPLHPAYTLCDLYTRPSFMPTYSFSKGHPICNLFDLAVETMEAQDRFTWYYTRAISPAYARIQQRGTDLLSMSNLGQRYDRYVQEIIKAGTRSQYTLHDALVQHREYNHNVMVVQAQLKNQHRKIGEVFIREADFYA